MSEILAPTLSPKYTLSDLHALSYFGRTLPTSDLAGYPHYPHPSDPALPGATLRRMLASRAAAVLAIPVSRSAYGDADRVRYRYMQHIYNVEFIGL